MKPRIKAYSLEHYRWHYQQASFHGEFYHGDFYDAVRIIGRDLSLVLSKL